LSRAADLVRSAVSVGRATWLDGILPDLARAEFADLAWTAVLADRAAGGAGLDAHRGWGVAAEVGGAVGVGAALEQLGLNLGHAIAGDTALSVRAVPVEGADAGDAARALATRGEGQEEERKKESSRRPKAKDEDGCHAIQIRTDTYISVSVD
jgi:hypothetical protein